MSRRAETIEALTQVSHRLETAAEGNEPFTCKFDGRPVIQITSFNPFVYEKYGMLHRGPRLAGRFALVGVAWAERPYQDDVLPFVVLRANRDQHYGVSASPQFLLSVAQAVDFPMERT